VAPRPRPSRSRPSEPDQGPGERSPGPFAALPPACVAPHPPSPPAKTRSAASFGTIGPDAGRPQADTAGRRHGGRRLCRRLPSSARPPVFASLLGLPRRLTPTGLPGPFRTHRSKEGPCSAPGAARDRVPRTGRRPPPRGAPEHRQSPAASDAETHHRQIHTKPPSIEEGGFVMSLPSAPPDLYNTFHTRAPCGADAAYSIGCAFVGESRSTCDQALRR